MNVVDRMVILGQLTREGGTLAVTQALDLTTGEKLKLFGVIHDGNSFPVARMDDDLPVNNFVPTSLLTFH